MNISYTWLKDFVDVSSSARDIRDLLTSRAATVDEVVPLRQDLKDVLIGRVVECEKHPDSDHLSVTQVDIGLKERLTVVCGAPNVVAGTLYPFAPVGSTLPGGFKIEKRKIRGIESNGMLCSASELGLGEVHTGIMALDLFVYPGTPFLDAYLRAGDTRFVIDVGANRADMLSHEGVAREISAAMHRPLRDPIAVRIEEAETTVSEPNVVVASTASKVTVRVEAVDDCPKYCAITIRGLTVGPSPDWLRERLEAVGVRSISNVVDVTNYMLHGFGQPMHAFDAKKLAGDSIIVRHAHAGERIRTLDGVERTLAPEMLVIADAERAQAIAGVIGGADSQVDETTTDIVLEVALFDPRSVRRTRRALATSTDASYRFERAMDAERIESFGRRAAALIVALAGGTITDSSTIVAALRQRRVPVTLRTSRIERVLGQWIPAEECKWLLRGVGFETFETQIQKDGEKPDELLEVEVPSWRADVTAEVDLIEEIARLRGYDSFSDTLRPFRIGTVPDAPAYTIGKRVSAALVAAGLYEVRPIPFVADAGPNGVVLRNPLAESEGMLRSSVVETLARRVEYNFARMTRDVRLFEVGVAFERGSETLPVERTQVAATVTGDRHPAHFTDSKPRPFDLWDARWLAELIGETAFGANRLVLVPDTAGLGWRALVDDVDVGFARQISVDAPVWATPVFGVEIDITSAIVAGLATTTPRYVPLPTQPATEFDLAFLLPAEVQAAAVDAAIQSAAGDLLESLVVFDEFRGKGVPDGFRSVAWRLTLRHPERTLQEKEIDGRRNKILRTVEQQLGVRQRTS